MTETMPRVVSYPTAPVPVPEIPCPTAPVPEGLAGPRAYACKVSGYAMSGDGIYDGDWVVIDPDKRAGNGDLAAVIITWNGRRGRVLKRIREGGWVLESSNPSVAPMKIGPENKPLAVGRVVAVIRAVE
jgi:SOS-response transcriptional repressor LexA